MDYWSILVDSWKTIAVITLASMFVASIFALSLPAIYRAEATLSPVTEQDSGELAVLTGQLNSLAELAGVNLGGDTSIEESIATLKSRSLTASFIREENLMPILFADAWDKEKNQWKDPENPPSDWDAYALFARKIRFLREDSKTGLVTLYIEWTDPEQAADWANKLVKRLNRERRYEAIKEATKSIVYLESQLRKTSVVEIQQAIYRLIEAETKNKMVANTREEYAFKIIDPAVVPKQRLKPRRTLIVITGMFGGVMLGIVFVFILNIRRFISSET